MPDFWFSLMRGLLVGPTPLGLTKLNRNDCVLFTKVVTVNEMTLHINACCIQIDCVKDSFRLDFFSAFIEIVRSDYSD